MTNVIEHIETDVRARILVTAERLFREITGRPRSRTSPEPCASARRISTVSLTPRSRSTQTSPIGSCGKWSVAVITTRQRPPSDCTSCRTVHRMNSDGYAGDSKMHEMAAAAMEENLDVCKTHIDCIIDVTAPVIADGVTSDEFHSPDVGNSPPLSSARQKRAPWNKQ
jgi:hypothetical protein